MAPALRAHDQGAARSCCANLVLGENAFPELIQEDCTPANLAQRAGAAARRRARRGERSWPRWRRIPERLQLPQGTPSEAAADIVLRYADGGRTSR